MGKPSRITVSACHDTFGGYNSTVDHYHCTSQADNIALSPIRSISVQTSPLPPTTRNIHSPFIRFKNLDIFTFITFSTAICLQLQTARAFPNSNESSVQYDEAEKAVSSINTNVTSANLLSDQELLHSDSPAFWWITFGAIAVVLLNGLVAGLTLGFMSLDTTNLQILATSGTEQEKRWAKRIIPIRQHGNLLLVTLLLCNTLMNETIPILADQVLPGGVVTILVSTAAVFIFSELLPQSICARHSLRVGAMFAWPVRILIYILFVIAWPISKVLDWMLGKDEGIIYRRAELKELVAIHGNHHEGPLSKNEVTIIRGAMDLQEKTAATIMTDLENVFAIDSNTMLNYESMNSIVEAGYSRVPVYEDSIEHIVGVVLIKSLIMLDPNDSTPVRDLKINHLPRVDGSTPLYEMLDKFQEGNSHMAVVCSGTSGNTTPVGIVTLEDVIEELIQEEIVDETDVYVDVGTKLRVVRALHSTAPSLLEKSCGIASAAVSATGLSMAIGLPSTSPRSLNLPMSVATPLTPNIIATNATPSSPVQRPIIRVRSMPRDQLDVPMRSSSPLNQSTQDLDTQVNSNNITVRNNANVYTPPVHRSHSWITSRTRHASTSNSLNNSGAQLRGFVFSMNGRERHKRRKPPLKRAKSESTIGTVAYDELRPDMVEITQLGLDMDIDNISTYTR